MKLFIIECGESTLHQAISAAASKMSPKPESISTLRLNMDRVSIPIFKKTLSDISADTIILNPPITLPDPVRWAGLVKEVVRYCEVMSARVLLVSSVEALGDTLPRTEVAVEMPCSDRGMILQTTESLIEATTSRYYIARFPYTIEDPKVEIWINSKPEPEEDEIFTLTTKEDMAREILTMVQSGWFGKFHVTPNDSLCLSGVHPDMKFDDTKRVPDRSLKSRTTRKMTFSAVVWKQLLENKACEASRTQT